MAITFSATGTVAAADIKQLVITRTAGGELLAKVTYQGTTSGGGVQIKSSTWTLSAGEKSTVAGLLPSAIAAIEADLGL